MPTEASVFPDVFVGALTLGHYLAHAERTRATGRLELRAGALRIGGIDVVDGGVVHAELPGARGDRALELLATLRRTDVTFAPLATRETTVSRGWRAFFPDPGEPTPPAVDHLERVFTKPDDPRRASTDLVVSATSAPQSATQADSAAFERIFREAVAAYARRDRAGARALFRQCLQLRPDDARARHNLARLGAEESG